MTEIGPTAERCQSHELSHSIPNLSIQRRSRVGSSEGYRQVCRCAPKQEQRQTIICRPQYYWMKQQDSKPCINTASLIQSLRTNLMISSVWHHKFAERLSRSSASWIRAVFGLRRN